MRFALAVIAALANAAGPWLCCCAMTAMLSGGTPVQAEAPPPDECAEKCSHCKGEGSNLPGQKSSVPAKPCPCKERLTLIPSVAVVTTDTVAVLDTIAATFGVAGDAVEVVSTTPPAPTQVCGLPFMTAETRQRVHHVLHC